ncbi:hypothetical protein EHS25_005427 [Saitozyma podzolica]|uniref:Uncharacterized protein n=1 Tax=Saitozyma podzolica TaxID=1890683 RepID=A0A427XYB5_9TREE|nr:hypothetical protein EHS25_005427 [Saitozyma podzolica]
MLEKGPGQGAYPFPAQGRQSWTTRMRMAFAGKVGRGGLARRVLVATLVIMVVLLLGKHVSRGTILSERSYSTPQHPLTSSNSASPTGHKTSGKTFGLPLFPFSRPAGSSSASKTGIREIDLASEPLPVEASLRERLDAWRDAPGGRGEVHGEVELGGSCSGTSRWVGLGCFVAALLGSGHYEWEVRGHRSARQSGLIFLRRLCAPPGSRRVSSSGDPEIRIKRRPPGGAGGAETRSHDAATPFADADSSLSLLSANVWATQNRTTLHAHRMDLINHMEDVLARNLTGDYGEGRGIVMVAGNADTLQRVKWSLQMLRSYESTLPVQIYHFPSERPDDDDPIWEEMRELGAELVEAVGEEKDKEAKKSYHLKAIAVVQCPWREVLYLDSDSIPARDPEYMFDAPNYRRLGIWATPDYWKTSANNPIWAIIGVKCRNEWEMETGQMFIDKKRHLDTFLLIKYMLVQHEWWFWFSDGDKDIFRWAMLALRKRWAVPGRWVGAAALPSGTASGDFCAHTMLQHDSWGEPLFVHYNLLKQIPSGIGRGFSWGRTKQLPLFNTFPASPATARLGEPESKPEDEDKPGLGDVDCDMLADADEFGVARSPAKEMIMRRAVRERGVKTKYHGGWISALCIDLEYIDPRPQSRKDEDAVRKSQQDELRVERDREWEEHKSQLEASGEEVPERPEEEPESPVYPDWTQSPFEVVQWSQDENLSGFERKIYDLGFKPSGPGF